MRGCRHKTGRRLLLLNGSLLLSLLPLGSCGSSRPAPPAAATGPCSPETSRGSVVAVSAVLRGAAPELGGGAEFANGAAFDGARLAAALQSTTRSAGTGFAIAPGGYVLTAEHVVADASSIWLTTSTGVVRRATVVAVDHADDLALLHAGGLELAPLAVAAQAASPGDSVYSYGNPGGRATTGQLVATSGEVTDLGRDLGRLSQREHRSYQGMIQSHMAITPGDSGGPLLNERGELVGMNAAAVLPSSDNENEALGYAFPADARWLTKVNGLLGRR